MRMTVNRFSEDESGAITVDWVVLTAAVVGLAMIALIPIAFTTDSSAQGVSDYISNLNAGYENQ